MKIILRIVLIISVFVAFTASAETLSRYNVNLDELTSDQSWFITDHELYDFGWEAYERVPMPDQPWFWVYKLPENAYAIYEPYQYELVISYLILGEETALLWDTGLGIGNMKACVEKLTDLPITVLNSHHHFDHIGNNALFDRVMCYNDDSAIETLTKGIPHEEIVEYIDPAEIVNPPEDFSPDTFFTAGKAPTATVEDGQVIDLGGRKLEVLYTPGHCTSSIMLIDEENGLLFTGDTWYPGWLYYFPEVYTLDIYLETLKKVSKVISERNLRQLYPSHDTILPGTTCFEEAIDFMERILNGQEDYEEIETIRLYQMNDLLAIEVLLLDEVYANQPNLR